MTTTDDERMAYAFLAFNFKLSVAKSLSKLYDEAKPLTSRIFANDLRIRIILCLDDNARFLDEITEFVEADKAAVSRNLKALEEIKVVQCIDEIYSLTKELGRPSAKFIRESREMHLF